MPRDYRLYLDDVLDSIKQINEYITGYDKEAFSKDRKTLDAVIRNLEIIGEAAGHLPEEIRSLTPITSVKDTGRSLLRYVLIQGGSVMRTENRVVLT